MSSSSPSPPLSRAAAARAASSAAGALRKAVRAERHQAREEEKIKRRKEIVKCPENKEIFLASIDHLPYHKRLTAACELAARLARSGNAVEKEKLENLIKQLKTHKIPDTKEILKSDSDSKESGDSEESSVSLFQPMTRNMKYYDEQQLALAMAGAAGNFQPFREELKTTERRFKSLAISQLAGNPLELPDSDLVALILSSVPAVRRRFVSAVVAQHRIPVCEALLGPIESTYSIDEAARLLHGCSSETVERILSTREDFLLNKNIRWNKLVLAHGLVIIHMIRQDFIRLTENPAFQITDYSSIWAEWSKRFSKGNVWEILMKKPRNHREISYELLKLSLEYGIQSYQVNTFIGFAVEEIPSSSSSCWNGISSEFLSLLNVHRHRIQGESIQLEFPSMIYQHFSYFLTHFPLEIHCYYLSTIAIYQYSLNESYSLYCPMNSSSSLIGGFWLNRFSSHRYRGKYTGAMMIELLSILFDSHYDHFQYHDRIILLSTVFPSLLIEFPRESEKILSIGHAFLDRLNHRVFHASHKDSTVMNFSSRYQYTSEVLGYYQSMKSSLMKSWKKEISSFLSGQLNVEENLLTIRMKKEKNIYPLKSPEHSHIRSLLPLIHRHRVNFLKEFLWTDGGRAAGGKINGKSSSKEAQDLQKLHHLFLVNDQAYMENIDFHMIPGDFPINYQSIHEISMMNSHMAIEDYIPSTILLNFHWLIDSSKGMLGREIYYNENYSLPPELMKFLTRHFQYLYSRTINMNQHVELAMKNMGYGKALEQSQRVMAEARALISKLFSIVWPQVRAFHLTFGITLVIWTEFLTPEEQWEIFSAFKASDLLAMKNHQDDLFLGASTGGVLKVFLDRISRHHLSEMQAVLGEILASPELSVEDRDELMQFQLLDNETWKKISKSTDSASVPERMQAIETLVLTTIRMRSRPQLVKTLKFLLAKVKNESVVNRLFVWSSLLHVMNRDDFFEKRLEFSKASRRLQMHEDAAFLIGEDIIPLWLEILQDGLEVQDLDKKGEELQAAGILTAGPSSDDLYENSNIWKFFAPHGFGDSTNQSSGAGKSPWNSEKFIGASRSHPLLGFFHRLSIKALRMFATFVDQPALLNFSFELQWRVAQFRLGEKYAARHFRLDPGLHLTNARTPTKTAGSASELNVFSRMDLIPGNEAAFVEGVLAAYKERVSERNPQFLSDMESAPSYMRTLFSIVGKAWENVPALVEFVQSALAALRAKPRDFEGVLILEQNERTFSTFLYLIRLHGSHWHEKAALREFVELLMNSRQAHQVFWLWFKWRSSPETRNLPGSEKTIFLSQTRAEAKERRGAIVKDLLKISKSAIYIKFVWRFLLRWDQPALDEFLNARNCFFGVFYLGPDQRNNMPEKPVKVKKPPVPVGRLSRARSRVIQAVNHPRADWWRGLESRDVKQLIKNEEEIRTMHTNEIAEFGRNDFAEYFTLPAFYGLQRLRPRQAEALGMQYIQQAQNPDRGMEDRVKAIIHFTLLPSTSFIETIAFLEQKAAFRIDKFLTFPQRQITLEPPVVAETKKKKKEKFPVNLTEALIKGILKDSNPFIPLQYLLQPQFLGSQEARVAIFSLGCVKPLLAPSELTKLLKFILTGKRRLALKITAYKEIIRMLAHNNTNNNRALILREWGRTDLHRDVRICIIQMAIGFLTGAGGRGVEDAWTILESAVRIDELFVQASLLGARPQVSLSALPDISSAFSSCGISLNFNPTGLVEDVKLAPHILSMRSSIIPTEHCGRFAENILHKLTFEDVNSDIRHCAIFALIEWLNYGNSREIAGSLWVEVALEKRPEFLVDSRPKSQAVFDARWRRAADYLGLLTNVSGSPMESFEPLDRELLENLLTGLAERLGPEAAASFSRSVRSCFLTRLEQLFSFMPFNVSCNDSILKSALGVHNGRLFTQALFNHQAARLTQFSATPSICPFSHDERLCQIMDFFYSGIHYYASEAPHESKSFLLHSQEIFEKIPRLSTAGRGGSSSSSMITRFPIELTQILLLELSDLLHQHGKNLSTLKDHYSGENSMEMEWRNLLNYNFDTLERAHEDFSAIRKTRQSYLKNKTEEFRFRDALPAMGEVEDFLPGSFAAESFLPPKNSNFAARLHFLCSLSLMAIRKFPEVGQESPRALEWFIDFLLAFHASARVGLKNLPEELPMGEIYLLDCVSFGFEGGLAPLNVIGRPVPPEQEFISAIGELIKSFLPEDEEEISYKKYKILDKTGRGLLSRLFQVATELPSGALSDPTTGKAALAAQILQYLALSYPFLTIVGCCGQDSLTAHINPASLHRLVSQWIFLYLNGSFIGDSNPETRKERLFKTIMTIVHGLENLQQPIFGKFKEEIYRFDANTRDCLKLASLKASASQALLRSLFDGSILTKANNSPPSPTESAFLFELAFLTFERYPTLVHSAAFPSPPFSSVGEHFMLEAFLRSVFVPTEAAAIRTRLIPVLATAYEVEEFHILAHQAQTINGVSVMRRIDPKGGDLKRFTEYQKLENFLKRLIALPTLAKFPTLFHHSWLSEESSLVNGNFLQSAAFSAQVGLACIEIVKVFASATLVAIEAKPRNAKSPVTNTIKAVDPSSSSAPAAEKDFSPNVYVWRQEFLDLLDHFANHASGPLYRAAMFIKTSKPMVVGGADDKDSGDRFSSCGSEEESTALTENELWICRKIVKQQEKEILCQ